MLLNLYLRVERNMLSSRAWAYTVKKNARYISYQKKDGTDLTDYYVKQTFYAANMKR